MLALFSFSALIFSIMLVQIGTGALGPLDVIAGSEFGFSTNEIGLLGSAHFVGFFIGCWVAPRLIGRVGPARTFAVFAVVGAVTTLLHPMMIDPKAWALLRIGAGFMIAGTYTVIEGWLQSSITNKERGRVFGLFRFADLMGSLIAQLIVAVLDPTSYMAYSVLAMFAMLALLPTATTQRQAPMSTRAPSLKPGIVFSISPLAGAGILVAGLTGASLRMVGPVYGLDQGLTAGQVGLFLMSAIAGGALVQPVVGWIADKVDRRAVLMGISLCAIVACMAFAFDLFGTGPRALYIAAFLFGATSFPVYSVSAAHANDFIGSDDDLRMELNASLIFLFGAGAIVSPLISAQLIGLFGADALFLFMGAAHFALIAYALYRATQRPTTDAEARTRYRYLPRTSANVSELAVEKKDESAPR